MTYYCAFLIWLSDISNSAINSCKVWKMHRMFFPWIMLAIHRIECDSFKDKKVFMSKRSGSWTTSICLTYMSVLTFYINCCAQLIIDKVRRIQQETKIYFATAISFSHLTKTALYKIEQFEVLRRCLLIFVSFH